jgi:hypothetical protein
MALRPEFDGESKDMAAFMVFSLRGIFKTIDESAAAWDEKNYWKKAEALRHKWRWTRTAADEIEALILSNSWYELSHHLITLIPHFSDVKISAITRDSDWWCGAYGSLVKKAKTVAS